MIHPKGLDLIQTTEWVESLGLEPYRAKQIRKWLFKHLARSFDEMTDLSKSSRDLLAKHAILEHLETAEILHSSDGTRKYLFRLEDGNHIESVLIPERNHFTLCISSQVGCAMGCRFCLTGKGRLKRNLSAPEIIDQVIMVKRDLEASSGSDERLPLRNIVLMGMGEPLANYRAVVQALKNLIAEDALNFSHRKITLSTCGITPKIRELMGEITVNLAVSLNATTDQVRSYLMPINQKFPLKELIQTCRDLPLPNRRMITFEYVLIKGVNDSLEDAERLVSLLKGIRGKVNLISLNPHPDLDLDPSPLKQILRFQERLVSNNVTAIIRKSKGTDIMAACGQLAGRHDLRPPVHFKVAAQEKEC